MLGIGQNEGSKPKCRLTTTTLPHFVHHEQPPSKKPPFSVILKRPSSHTLEILLPEQAAQKFQNEIENGQGNLHYAKVYMKLGDVIQGEFFDHYIKTGNIIMVSEGRPGIDHTFTLTEGVLRLEIDKATFERAGLPGKPIASPGQKHVTARFAVELILRLPSMVRGRNAFDRAVWAFKNVLNETLTWLFYDLKPEASGLSPIAAHQPIMRDAGPNVDQLPGVLVPGFPHTISEEDVDVPGDLLEWLTLAIMLSPRVLETDQLDPYLCRYQTPDLAGASPSVQTLWKFRWHGLLPARFAHKLVLVALASVGDDWVAVNAAAFTGEAYTMLLTGGRGFIWEYKD